MVSELNKQWTCNNFSLPDKRINCDLAGMDKRNNQSMLAAEKKENLRKIELKVA